MNHGGRYHHDYFNGPTIAGATMKKRFRQWKPYLLRWSVVLLAALPIFVTVFFASRAILPPILAWAASQASFPGATDLIDSIRSLGPLGLASGLFIFTMRLGAAWVRRAVPLPAAVDLPLSPRVKDLRPYLRPLLLWTTVITVFVVIPALAMYEQLERAGGLSFDAVLCFAFGCSVMVALASRMAPAAERLNAATVGTLWRWGVVDLRDQWRSTYQYVSGGESKTGVQIMAVTQIGKLARAKNIGGSSPHRHAIRMTINGDYVTGEWRNTVHGARHHGVFQLRIKANGREMVGTWIGFDGEANIQDGHWIWERL